MLVTPIQTGNSLLRPRARLIKTIGEELISNDIVAILELVKNSYDADSSIIVIEFEGRVIIEKDGKSEISKIIKHRSSIDIYDDGSGMSLDIIKTAWMEPATISKKKQIKSSIKDRRYTGEKGIGRFASAKLSKVLKIITRVKNDNEVVVDFNWQDFDDIEKYLDQINCNWEVRSPIEFLNGGHGTRLRLTNLNSDWDEEKIRQLRISLQRLINPVSPIIDFLIELKLPKEFESYSGIIEPPDYLTKPNYSIKGIIDEVGNSTITYTSKKGGAIELKDFVLLSTEEKFKTGPFGFDFRVWDRDNESLSELANETNAKISEVKNALNDVAGVSIYRDKFRVLPYGDPKLDWLRLDLRRVNNPTMRISNNQIIGFISIELEKNPAFSDQSNRQGIVDSEAFEQLRAIVSRILNELEIKRYAERPRESNDQKSTEGIFSNFSIDPVAQLVKSKLPNDKEANELVANTESRIQEGVKKIQEVLARYRRLSTLGLLIDVLLHDGNNFLARIDTETHLLSREILKEKSDIDAVKGHIANINSERKILAQLFKRLAPFGGRKRGRPKDIILEDAISNVFSLYKTDLEKLNISISLPDSSNIVRIDDGELQMIIVNLLQNSLYWLESVKKERKIKVEVERSDADIAVIFSDSGPGIKEEYQSLIFDPYFSTRPDGVGLGLTIVGELINEYDGDFLLVDNGPLDGATFKLTFKRRI
jgi:signal transduction histidine kinase